MTTLEASPYSEMRESCAHEGSCNERPTEPSLTKTMYTNGGTIEMTKTNFQIKTETKKIKRSIPASGNRTQKREETRRQVGIALEPQESARHGAQEGMTRHIDNNRTDVSQKLTGELRIATFNCNRENHISVREKIFHVVRTYKLDIIFLQETDISTNTEEIHDNNNMLIIVVVVLFSRLPLQVNNEKMQPKAEKKQDRGKVQRKQKARHPLQLYTLTLRNRDK